MASHKRLPTASTKDWATRRAVCPHPCSEPGERAPRKGPWHSQGDNHSVIKKTPLGTLPNADWDREHTEHWACLPSTNLGPSCQKKTGSKEPSSEHLLWLLQSLLFVSFPSFSKCWQVFSGPVGAPLYLVLHPFPT